MKIVLVGGGGHCAVCADVALGAGLEIAGLLDPRPEAAVPGLLRLGDDSWLDTDAARAVQLLVTVGQTRAGGPRQALFEAVLRRGLTPATVVAATAVTGRGALIGGGSIVMHRAVVNAGARVGENCIVNTAAVVEHGAVLGSHCHIAPGAVLGGEVSVGEGSMIGAGAVVLPGLHIAPQVTVGAGAVVTRSIEAAGTWAGVPARRMA